MRLSELCIETLLLLGDTRAGWGQAPIAQSVSPENGNRPSESKDFGL
jgi:hypothetical protein